MNINQNITFLKNEMPAPVMTTSKTSAAVSGAAAPALAIANPARLPVTTSDFDAARVAEIRESIRAGNYQINTAKIADGLLSSIQDLMGRNRP